MVEAVREGKEFFGYLNEHKEQSKMLGREAASI